MKTYTAKLRETSSYKVRHATLTRWEGGGNLLGVLEVVEQRSPGAKEYHRRYAVGELGPNDEGRRFQLTKPKLLKDPDDEFYVVNLTRAGARCTCKAGLNGVYCLHQESLVELSDVPGALAPEFAAGVAG